MNGCLKTLHYGLTVFIYINNYGCASERLYLRTNTYLSCYLFTNRVL